MRDINASRTTTLRTARPGAALVFFASTALVLVGCSAPRPKRLLDLETPMFAWHSEAAFCGKLRVVDGAHRLWTEQGCEGTTTGFVFARPVPKQNFEAIVKAFASLPHDVPDCAPASSAVHIFTAREGSIQKTWRLCLNDSSAPIPPAFAAVEEAFGAITK